MDNEPQVFDAGILAKAWLSVALAASTYLRRLAAKAERDGLPRVEVSVGLNVVDESDAPTLAGLESRYVRIEYEAAERVQLEIYGGEYPKWRTMVTGFEPESVDAVSLNPEILGRLARAGKILDNAPVSWRFSGEHKAADVTLSALEPRVTGVVMPIYVGGE